MTSVWKEKQELQGLTFTGEEVIVNTTDNDNIEEVMEELESLSDEEGMIEVSEEDVKVLDDLQDELKSFTEEMNEKFDDLVRDEYDLNKLQEGIEELIENNKDNKEGAAQVRQLKQFLSEMQEVVTFDPLLKSVSKIKNKDNIKSLYVSNFESALNKFTKKIKNNRSYTFIKPNRINIKEQTYKLLSDMDDSMLFLYLFFGFASQQKNLTTHALFINELLRQIKHVDKIKDVERERLISNMRKTLDIVK